MNPRPNALHAVVDIARHNVAGLELDYLTPDDFVRLLLSLPAIGPGFCCVPNAHQCVEAHRDRSFRGAVNAATYRLSDSRILGLARRFVHGVPNLPTMKGANLLLAVARAAASEGRRIGFFGGSEQTLAKLNERLQAEIPGIEIGYSFSPPYGSFSELGDPHYARAINEAGVDVLFVGLGCPKQEWWMYRNRQLVQPFMIGVGAAFDFVAGTKRSSPEWVHRIGLEWLYRFAQEPRRLWRRYVVDAPLFILLVLKQKLARPTP